MNRERQIRRKRRTRLRRRARRKASLAQPTKVTKLNYCLASMAKPGEETPNEDSAYIDASCLALSDGAGGCGLYADRWSHYLVSQLDKQTPLMGYEALDSWVEQIWQPFYNDCEAMAKEGDAMLLNKFYSEGSCATLVAAWIGDNRECRWIAYGDSVLFHYNRATGELWHSFTSVADFDNPPHLISCKDPLTPVGFSEGSLALTESSVLFAASDALSCIVLMMYQVSRWTEYADELEALIAEHSSGSHRVQLARAMKFDFYEDVLKRLIDSASSGETFAQQMHAWLDEGLLELDDYTVAFLKL